MAAALGAAAASPPPCRRTLPENQTRTHTRTQTFWRRSHVHDGAVQVNSGGSLRRTARAGPAQA
eukprot:7922433-Pyramimonas_sp.AAC.1